MSSTATTWASRALEAVLAVLEDAGIEASRDSGAFYPQPVGVLLGLPTLVGRTAGGACTFTLEALVVSGDPLNATLAVDRLYALADDVAAAVGTNAYRPSSYRSSINAEPLPAIAVDVTYTIPPAEEAVAP